MPKLSLLTYLLFKAGALVVPAQQLSPDTLEIRRHIDAAQKTGGPMWADAAKFFCSTEQEVAAMHILPSATQNDPPETRRAEPRKVFDNLYFVGTKEVTTWVITTPAGYILIDSGFAGDEETTLVPGMKKLGLDPAQIKDVVIAHGHTDHYGGALYLQQHFGARVYMSAADWDFIEPKPGKKGDSGPQPKRDLVASDGEPIVLGGEKITPVSIPGHTPGSLGFVFPVMDNGKQHVVGLFGGTILNPQDRFPASLFEQYLKSIQRFKDVTQKMRVDVELVNHPIMDGTFTKLDALATRRPGQPNPFVVGEKNFNKFVDVMAECATAQLLRHGGKL